MRGLVFVKTYRRMVELELGVVETFPRWQLVSFFLIVSDVVWVCL